MALVLTLLIGLASWRLWQLVAHDEILDRPRSWLPASVQRWLACPYCSGFWVAIVVTALADRFEPGVPLPVLVAAAAAAVVVLVESVLDPEGS